MIKKLHIKNYQSHKNTSLNFSKGVNVITGSTDSGKTSIIRALRWLVWNRPTGASFCSDWTKDDDLTAVRARVEDKDVVRDKSKGANHYRSNKMVFKAFGTDVPDEIKKLLNLSEINLQQQMDSPFLLTNSPGEVAQHFNRVARLDKIDQGLRNVQRKISQIGHKIENERDHVKEQQQELKQYKHLAKFEMDVEVLEDMQGRMEQTISNGRNLNALTRKITNVEQEIEVESEQIQAEHLVEHLLQTYGKRTDAVEKVDNLSGLLGEIKDTNKELEKYSEITKLESTVTTTLELLTKRAELDDVRALITKLIYNITSTEKRLQNGLKYLKKLEADFNEAMPSTCPLCGQKIEKNEK